MVGDQGTSPGLPLRVAERIEAGITACPNAGSAIANPALATTTVAQGADPGCYASLEKYNLLWVALLISTGSLLE